MMDPETLVGINVLLACVTVAFGAAHLALRGEVIQRQTEEIAGLRASLAQKNLFGFDDEFEMDDFLDEVSSDLMRINDLIARGHYRDARHEIERTLEHYA